jgi:hypothetical protein
MFTITAAGCLFNPKDKVPFTNPVPVGLNVTFTVQLAPTANEVPQVLVSVNTLGDGTMD